MQFTFTKQADEYERFTSDAFDSQIGKVIPVTSPAGQMQGRLVAVEIQNDGREALMTIEVETLGDLIPDRLLAPGGFGFIDA